MSATYNTDQKKKIIEFLRANPDRQFTASEICENVNENAKGISTVYRQLTKLCEQKIARKFNVSGSHSTVYQFAGENSSCDSHFHLKCLSCGRIWHLHCHLSEELTEHIAEFHSFNVDSGKSILYGICENCAKKEK